MYHGKGSQYVGIQTNCAGRAVPPKGSCTGDRFYRDYLFAIVIE